MDCLGIQLVIFCGCSFSFDDSNSVTQIFGGFSLYFEFLGNPGDVFHLNSLL